MNDAPLLIEDFVPIELLNKLYQLGFNEPTWFKWDRNGQLKHSIIICNGKQDRIDLERSDISIPAPTMMQAFNFLLGHRMSVSVSLELVGGSWGVLNDITRNIVIYKGPLIKCLEWLFKVRRA